MSHHFQTWRVTDEYVLDEAKVYALQKMQTDFYPSCRLGAVIKFGASR